MFIIIYLIAYVDMIYVIIIHTYCEAGWPTGPVSERHILDLPPRPQELWEMFS